MITLAQSALAKRKAGGSGMSPGEEHGVILAERMGRTTLRQRPRCQHRDGIVDTESCAFLQLRIREEWGFSNKTHLGNADRH